MPTPAENEPRWLGLDEAGRGSVLGPLVIGGFCLPPDRIGELRSIGVKDSKRLSPARREELLGQLDSLGECLSLEISPERIDTYVARRGLNELEVESFAELVRRARPTHVFADACDPVAARFGRKLARSAAFPGPIVSRHKADRDLPVVSAASIVAKVVRDRAIARLASMHSIDLGSGYPSDERSVLALRSSMKEVGRVPDWARRSWATTERVKRELTAQPLETFDP